MCLLTFFPADTVPDARALRNGATTNPHGHGYALLVDGTIRTGHGMDPEPVLAEFLALRAEHPGGLGLFHSRYATRGIQDLSNCHPFHLGGDPRTVLAHNGTLPKRVHPGPYDPRSDTRIAAEDYLPTQPFGSIDTRRGARGLTDWLGRSKLVILTVDPAYAHRAYILNQHAGIWEDGIWYSNDSYQPFSRRWPSRYREFLCGGCGHLDLDRPGRLCTRCGWCTDCRRALAACDCLTRPHTRTTTRTETVAALTRRPAGHHARPLHRRGV
ncbi:hypothetical protein ACWEKT_41165 [Nocardia takedensis]